MTLSTHDNEKLLQRLKLGFKRAVGRNSNQKQQYRDKTNFFDYLIDSSFQGGKRFKTKHKLLQWYD